MAPGHITPINLQVSPIPTIALSSAQSNVAVFDTGATISIVATVNDVGGAPAPTGTVQFYDGSTSIGAPVPILLGAATYSSSSSQFALGTHSITAVYSGNSTYGKVTSAPITFTVVSQITDTLSLISSPASTPSGSAFGITATINFNQVLGAPAPAGTVTFSQNGKAISTVTVSNSQAQGMLNAASSPLAQGTYIFSASYSGDSTHSASSSGNVTVTITGDPPKFSLTSNAGTYSNVVQGTPITFTATAGAVNGLSTPTGTVQFYVDSVAAGTPLQLTSGAATYTTSSLSTGSHTVTASYSGNSTYDSTTTSGVVAVVTVVTQGSDAIALTAPSTPTVEAGTSFTITGTLNVTSLGPPPTGTVALLDNGTALATATLSGNPPFALSFLVNTVSAPLTGGTHSFTLQYPGGGQWTPATSTSQTVAISDFTVVPIASSVTVSPGASATETLNVSYLGNLAATTTFACSGPAC